MSIRMTCVLSGRLCGMSLSDFFNKPKFGLSFGGFEMEIPIHGKSIPVPFDWESYIVTLNNDGTLTLRCGESTFFSTGSDEELDDVYEEEWKKLGVTREDLIPETMAESTAINEFYVDYEPVPEESDEDVLYIQRLSFLDDAGREYDLSDEVLKKVGNILTL